METSIQIKIQMEDGMPIVTGINKEEEEVIVCQYLEKDIYNLFINGFDDEIVVTKNTLRMYRDVIIKMIGE